MTNTLIKMGLDVFKMVAPFERLHAVDIGLLKWLIGLMSAGADRDDLNTRLV